MNEKSCPSESSSHARREELLDHLPVYAFESECQRSLEMIELCQRYMAHLVEGKEDPDSCELRHSLSDMAVAAGRLDRNLTNLTSLLRCIQGSEAPRWEPVELCSFAQTICSEQAQIQQTLGIQLTLDCGPLTELYIDADRSYLASICLQLLSNALRACTPGGGQVTLSIRPGDQGGAVLTIADTGCGLPDSTSSSSQSNRSRFLGTTKSGLLLCQEYCRLTGWTLELHSQPLGQGTQAVLTIPPRNDFHTSSLLRSVSPEELQHAQRQLWLALTFELSCVPGMEEVQFHLPAKFT